MFCGGGSGVGPLTPASQFVHVLRPHVDRVEKLHRLARALRCTAGKTRTPNGEVGPVFSLLAFRGRISSPRSCIHAMCARSLGAPLCPRYDPPETTGLDCARTAHAYFRTLETSAVVLQSPAVMAELTLVAPSVFTNRLLCFVALCTAPGQ